MILAAAARAQLEKLIVAFDDPAMPYHPLPDPDFVPKFRLYDHLSRRAEWGVASAAEDELVSVLTPEAMRKRAIEQSAPGGRTGRTASGSWPRPAPARRPY